jgi:hypothetical protein
MQTIAAGLSAGDQEDLKFRCRHILGSPRSFAQDLVKFCRMVSRL